MIKLKKIFKNFTTMLVVLNIFCINIIATDSSLPIVADAPYIDATAYMLFDQDTGNILMEKNIDLQLYPASTTKILTAILVIENSNLDDMVTITEDAFWNIVPGSSSAGLVATEIMSVHDLLYCMMLSSANEASNALAIHVGGTVENFVNMMNYRAIQLGAYNSNFTNPNGLHNENHYTTARDMSIITKYAMKNDFFYTIVNTAQKTIAETNKNAEKRVYTSNQLILRTTDPRYYQYANGVKTGFTTPAGNCLVAQAEKSNMNLISLVFDCTKSSGGENMVFTRTKEMFEWGFNNYKSQILVEKLEPVLTLDVRLSSKNDYVSVKTATDVRALVPIDFDAEKVTLKYLVPKSVNAPILADDKLGAVQVFYDGIYYETIDLIAVNDVEMSQVLYYVDVLEQFFMSLTFKIILVSLICLLALSVVTARVRDKKRIARRRKQNSNRYR